MIQDFAILIHGINPDPIPGDGVESLVGFLSALCRKDAHLAARFPPQRVIPIRWGHPQQARPDEGSAFRTDEQLFLAQNRILQAITAVEPELTPDDYLPWSRAQLAQALQRTLLISGIGDVVYFSGVDGYRTIQRILFRTLRQRVEQLRTHGDLQPGDRIRLNLFAESLGVTIGFEFFSLLFGPARKGHELGDVLDPHDLAFFRASASAFVFGSFVSAASQLPLLLQRRQHVIEQFANGSHLDPAHMGILSSCACPRWLLFHDPRDILSMPTRVLFGDCPWILEEWVENQVTAMAPADRFEETHHGYWMNPQVMDTTRSFLRRACDLPQLHPAPGGKQKHKKKRKHK